MPHIIVKLATGHAEAEKQQLAQRITQAAVESLHVGEGEVSVGLEEIDPQQWMQQVYAPEIQAKWSTLYTQPGYGPEAEEKE